MDFPWIRVGPVARRASSCSNRCSSVRRETGDEAEAGDEEEGDLTGDMTRDRDVRTETGGGDLTGVRLPLEEDMLAAASRGRESRISMPR